MKSASPLNEYIRKKRKLGTRKRRMDKTEEKEKKTSRKI